MDNVIAGQFAPKVVNVKAPQPKQRDPNKIFVAMILEETLTRETSLFWEEIGKEGVIPGVEIVRYRLVGPGLVKARNICTYAAWNTDCGKFVFIDSDMKPSVRLLAQLIAHDVEAVSGMYPKKRADRLEWVGNMSGTGKRPDGLTECLEFGGGFCCINLCAVDGLIEKIHDEVFYICEDQPFKDVVMWDLWSNGVVVDNWRGRRYPRFLTEDFYFCWRLRVQLGIKVWMDTNCQVGHVGPVDFLEFHVRMQELVNQSIHRAPSGG